MDDATSAPSAPVEPSAPSAPPDGPAGAGPVTPSDRLAQMSPVERAAWRQDGTVPGTAPVVSAQGDGDAGEATEDHSAAPEPPPVDPVASAAGRALQKKKQTAQERINELARKNYLLEGELKGLRSAQDPSRPAAAVEAPPPASPPASRPPSYGLVEPQEGDFPIYADFIDARADYRYALKQAAAEEAQAQAAGQQQRAAAAAAHDARVRTFAAAHPDYLDVITTQTEVYPTPLLADAVLHSDLAPEIAYYLNTHVDEYRALVALPPGPQIKALGKLEARLEATTGTPPAAAASPTNHVTRAPAPPVTLGSRPAEPADDVERAGARRDVGAYLRAANARELASRR